MTKERQLSSDSMVAAKPSLIWDCGSSLYDSFELKSFERQLGMAIASRTMSMPHLSDNHVFPLSSSSESGLSNERVGLNLDGSKSQRALKKGSKISRTFQKLLKSVFRPKHNTSSPIFPVQDKSSSDEVQVICEKCSALSPIWEVTECDGLFRRISGRW
ncbi:PREDICTED: uncharacterized protein LOC109213760 [Nicotiana attenuata]|uniref:Uncharacterized protein n=1 Tax=Nicotiana attenuata TaxID=49451 RepID=A0A1J6KDW2_NICAT|nr:PREDICTED: uncharacterized protein LOC109213760 [Nicotiana attenuata]OIT27574.1 hypothetical protein A4A49_35020 [Nicotiana attenuata]